MGFFQFNFGISPLVRTIQCFCRYNNLPQLNMLRMRSVLMEIRRISRRSSRSSDNAEFGHSRCCFAEDGKEMYQELSHVRAQLLFCSLNLLFGDVLVAVVVVFCVRSLMSHHSLQLNLIEEIGHVPY